MEEFNLAISASKTYAPYAKVMLLSFYKTHPNSKVNLYLFYLDPTIKNLESEFIQVINLADIHIRNKSDRDDEYRSVIEHLNLNIKNDKQLKKNETLIIICGDIFHDARKDGKLSPNAIQMFKNLISKLTSPVKWTQSINKMIDDGTTEFIEIGPGKVLQGLIKKINKEVLVTAPLL